MPLFPLAEPTLPEIPAGSGTRITAHLRARRIGLEITLDPKAPKRRVPAFGHQSVPGRRKVNLHCCRPAARETQFLVASRVTGYEKDILPICIAGTVSTVSSPVHANQGGVMVSVAPSSRAMCARCRETGYAAGSNALPGFPQ